MLGLLLGGCAATPGPPDLAAAFPVAGPLDEVPFHPQEIHQCGPAALATVLGAAGVAIDPRSLAERVYVPGRRGSFQAELIAATRSAGRVPYPVDGTLAGLAAEVAAGRPVLVLQNLALRRLPRWHYAVVIGLDARAVTLRSGRRARLRVPHREFLRSWTYAGNWGFVVLRPGEWPARPEPHRWLAAMSDQEQLGQRSLAAAGYAAAVERWPTEPLAWFALGNSRYRLGQVEGARLAYQRATELQPGFGAAWNNLAQTLGELGCGDAARAALARGQAVADATQQRALEVTASALPAPGQPASSTASACSSASGSP